MNIERDFCSGCGACSDLCPCNAITFKTDEFGFKYPQIDSQCCSKCGICEKYCSFKPENIIKHDFKAEYYAAYNTDASELYESTSGGVFFILAKYIIKQNGFVCGALLNDELRVVHELTDSIEICRKMRGSKYVQSDIGDCYKSVAEKLTSGFPVLFVGTPCQCSGLKVYLNFLKINCDKLIICDFVCHGVASPQMFSDYIDFCEHKSSKKIINHIFRDKKKGWHAHVETNVFSDGSIDSDSYESQIFKSIFYSHMALRPSCYECSFSDVERVSDITIGDCWGINKSHPDFDFNTGVSLVMINSETGKKCFDCLSGMNVIPICITDTEQPNLYSPSIKPVAYDEFCKKYVEKGFYGIIKKYFHYGFVYSAYRYLKKILKV